MKQYRVFITGGYGQVTLKNNLNQVVGILDPDNPELTFNEIVFHNMGKSVNGFVRMGAVGFEELLGSRLLGPTFEEVNLTFPEVKGPVITILDPQVAEVTTERPEEKPIIKTRAPINTNPVSVSPDPGRIIVKSRKTQVGV
jgi:hypothetical protein